MQLLATGGLVLFVPYIATNCLYTLMLDSKALNRVNW